MESILIPPTGRITYRQLKSLIDSMIDEQLDCDVTLYDKWEEESFPIGLQSNHDTPSFTETDVLDKGHPIFVFT